MKTFFILVLLSSIVWGIIKFFMAVQEQIPGVNEPKTYISNGKRYRK